MMNPVFMPTIHGVQGPLEDAGYIPIIMNIGNEPQRERAAVGALFERQIDGLIDAASTDPDPIIERLSKRNFPIVTINRIIESLSVNAVVNDNARGMALAVNHLFKLGHRRIAHVSAPLSVYTG
jgi:LacI family transcriptional regulator